MNEIGLRQELISSPKVQAAVASSSIFSGFSGLMGYIETASALVALLAGTALTLFMAYNSLQKIKQSKLETKSVILDNKIKELELKGMMQRKEPRD